MTDMKRGADLMMRKEFQLSGKVPLRVTVPGDSPFREVDFQVKYASFNCRICGFQSRFPVVDERIERELLSSFGRCPGCAAIDRTMK